MTARRRLCGAVAIAALIVGAAPGRLRADTWGGAEPKAALSPSGLFVARTAPGGPASLSLWDRGSKKKIYEVNAVNSMSPVGLFVADMGEVLTVDDWGEMGNEHAVVLYDRAGHVVRDYQLKNVLSPQEIREKTERSVSSTYWRYPTESPWADRDSFHITTIFGAEIIVSLKDGNLKRGTEPFARLRSHLKGVKACMRPELRVVHVAKDGDKYPAVTCVLGPLERSCHEGATGFGEPRHARNFPLDSLLFDELVESSASLIPWIERNWATTWGEDKVQVELSFACSQAAPDQYRFVVDRCAVKDPKAAAALDKLLSVTDLSSLVYCPGARR